MKEKRKLYLELIFGSIGMLIVSLYIANALWSEFRSMAIPPLILGFSLMNGYIFFLEKKAGFSKKVIWTQSLVLVFIIILYIGIKY